VSIVRKRVAGVVLLRDPDDAALLQHRDDKPGLPHANLWVPPGGHCEDGESYPLCAVREFYEETSYRCARLRFLAELDVDGVPFAPPLHLTIYWDIYDGCQPVVCHEGQALEFVPRSRVPSLAIPDYLVDLWDRALAARRLEDRLEDPQATASTAAAPIGDRHAHTTS
jgi:8-oxo-dGTP pyrophosphatase MutT (NUDIX family)